MSPTKTLIFLALVFVPGVLLGATVALDVLPGGPEPTPPDPFQLVELGGRVYFAGEHPLTGGELFTSNGRASGTHEVRDICPGRCSTLIDQLTVSAGRLFFKACEDVRGCQLWTSDGSREGTRPLTADPIAFDFYGQPASDISQITAWRNGIAFTRGNEIWRSDGTVDGTILVGRIDRGSNPVVPRLTAAGDRLLIFLHWDVRFCDGTSISPPLNLDGGVFYGPSLTLGDRAFFGTAGTTPGFWVSDGTPEGTVKLADVPAPRPHFTDGRNVFFQTSRTLWVSDGTPGGTRRVRGVPPAGDDFAFAAAVRHGAAHFVLPLARGGSELWQARPSGRYARRVTTLPGRFEPAPSKRGPIYLYSSFFSWGARVLRSFGTAASTVEVFSGDGRAWEGFGISRGVVFSVRHSIGNGWSAQELAYADHRGGRELVLQHQPPGADPYPLAVQGDQLFFGSQPHRQGGVTDGTSVGTVMAGDGDFWPTEAAGQVFFHDFRPTSDNLWTFDGAGTLQALLPAGADDVHPKTLTEYGGRAFFLGQDFADNGLFSLWASDGTPAGTVEIQDGLPPAICQSSNGDPSICDDLPIALVPFNGLLHVALLDTLWTSDGTPGAVTAAMTGADLCASCSAWSFQGPRVMGGRLFFVLNRRLWAGDGTPAGSTSLPGDLFRLDEGPVTVDDRLLVFHAHGDGDEDTEPWVSDGTSVQRLLDVRPGTDSSRPRDLVPFDGQVYFTADDGVHGRELWVSDGTAAGTRMVADLNPGAEPSAPQELAVVDGRLFFAADDGVHGLEPWVIDGTGAAPLMLDDVEPGVRGSSPRDFVLFNGHVTFNAGNSVVGFELWQE